VAPSATTIRGLRIYQAFPFRLDLNRASAAVAGCSWPCRQHRPLVAVDHSRESSLGPGGQDRPLHRWTARGGLQRGDRNALVPISLAAVSVCCLLTSGPAARVIVTCRDACQAYAAAGTSCSTPVALNSAWGCCWCLRLPLAAGLQPRPPAAAIEAVACWVLAASPLMIGNSAWFILI